METAVLIITLILMFAGVAGAVLPILPSVPLVYAGYILYGLVTGWREYGVLTMIGMGALTALVMVMDYLAGAIGAQKFGASRFGIIGAVVGAIAGFVFFFGIIGMIIGPLVGAVAFEMLFGRRPWQEAVRSGWGTFVGFLAGTFFKLVASMIMVAVFIGLVIFR